MADEKPVRKRSYPIKGAVVLALYKASGLRAEEFARRSGTISADTLYRWFSGGRGFNTNVEEFCHSHGVNPWDIADGFPNEPGAAAAVETGMMRIVIEWDQAICDPTDPVRVFDFVRSAARLIRPGLRVRIEDAVAGATGGSLSVELVLSPTDAVSLVAAFEKGLLVPTGVSRVRPADPTPEGAALVAEVAGAVRQGQDRAGQLLELAAGLADTVGGGGGVAGRARLDAGHLLYRLGQYDAGLAEYAAGAVACGRAGDVVKRAECLTALVLGQAAVGRTPAGDLADDAVRFAAEGRQERTAAAVSTRAQIAAAVCRFVTGSPGGLEHLLAARTAAPPGVRSSETEELEFQLAETLLANPDRGVGAVAALLPMAMTMDARVAFEARTYSPFMHDRTAIQAFVRAGLIGGPTQPVHNPR